MMQHIVLYSIALVVLLTNSVHAQAPLRKPKDQASNRAAGDAILAEYFRLETARISEDCLSEIETLSDWTSRRDEYRQQLFEMLGLSPLPERTDLQATTTGSVEHEDFVVENVHFQSRPGLYVTGNLYIPKERPGPLPAVLYVCGHGRVKIDGVSYGSKVHYQHHGGWFARNGYVCLTIDTLQLGEIEGIHHGTYREKMWWWLNRGYTPAGVEAWNCVRALDYLESRPEVDATRMGVTGRSGGGAYSWWIAAIDERIKCAVPVAGITDLKNHVVAGMPGRFADGCVEGHCDCMYMFNTYRWDYAQVAALVAPRPLLISNTDTDGIFPLDGVYRLFEQTRKIYRLYDAPENIALNIAAGGHADTQQLRVNAFHWFNRHLKGEEPLISDTAEKYFEPKQLRVFDQLPSDQLNTEIHERFVEVAQPVVPSTVPEWEIMKARWLDQLNSKCFAGWPDVRNEPETRPVFSSESDGLRLQAFEFSSQEPFRLNLFVAQRAGVEAPDLVVLNVLDQDNWPEFLSSMRPAFEKELKDIVSELPDADEAAYQQNKKMFNSFNWAMAYVAPRGIGLSAWNPDEFKQTQHRRRFYLLGQSLDGMRVWDVRQAIRTLRFAGGMQDVPLWLQAHGSMAGVTLYASLFEPDIKRLDLHELPQSHREGPFFLNVRRVMDLPQAVALASAKSKVVLYQDSESGWSYPQEICTLLKRDANLQIRSVPPAN